MCLPGPSRQRARGATTSSGSKQGSEVVARESLLIVAQQDVEVPVVLQTNKRHRCFYTEDVAIELRCSRCSPRNSTIISSAE
jgi:hypothetical protein